MSSFSSKSTKDQEWIKERIREVNNKYSTSAALSEIGVELSNEENDESIFCPFHDNSQSPAARYYAKAGSELSHLYCFVCKKRWYGFDVYLKKNRNQFKECLEKLERRFHIQVKRPSESTKVEIRSERDQSAEWDNIDRLFTIIESKIKRASKKCTFQEFMSVCLESDVLEWNYKKNVQVKEVIIERAHILLKRIDVLLSAEEICI